MPRSATSYNSLASAASRYTANGENTERPTTDTQHTSRSSLSRSNTDLVSPQAGYDGPRTSRHSSRRRVTGERTPLLPGSDEPTIRHHTRHASVPGTPGALLHSASFAPSVRGARAYNRSRRPSTSLNFTGAGNVTPAQAQQGEPASVQPNLPYGGREWYDDFTSIDWVRDSIADAHRVKELRSRRDWKGRVIAVFDGGQGWMLVAIIGIFTAIVAYTISVTESILYDFKYGYCTRRWWFNKSRCCSGARSCDEWRGWADGFSYQGLDSVWIEFATFNAWVILFALLSCMITLLTKTTVSSSISLSTLDENFGAEDHSKSHTEGRSRSMDSARHFGDLHHRPPINYYPAAGSGVAEVKVILSGFVLHGYLGVRTLVCKTVALILSVASGMSLGKEGKSISYSMPSRRPYVHIATCIGNIVTRFVPKYRENDGKRREVLSAAAAAGVAVAFGAPLAGVLFSLEEVSYYFPPKVLFRTFFCCIVAALSLRFLDPYGTGNIVLFKVNYLIDWKLFELLVFVLLGICGGVLGAFFIKGARAWGKTFRRLPVIKKYPLFEVFLVALATGLCSFWNRFTRLPVAELLFELASPCNAYSDTGTSLCPTEDRIPYVVWYLCIAFVIKAALTLVTFGLKVPAGIYVPSMVVGGILGRIVGHLVQLTVATFPESRLFASCSANHDQVLDCVTPGVYALVAAGATMCGVTRLSVTLAVILFELTGSLEYVLPFSLAIMAAKWTADLLEPSSIYDLLTDMNAYPYLDAKVRPVFTSDLSDLATDLDENHFIDISISPLVLASELRSKLIRLHLAGELDGGLPILRDRILVGLIPAPDLEFALDRLDGEESALCLMSTRQDWQGPGQGTIPGSLSDGAADANVIESGRDADSDGYDPTDFTPHIDSAPVSLDISSPMDLVFECFVKLGLRYICILREGRFCGMVHKKRFVRYVKQVEREGKYN